MGKILKYAVFDLSRSRWTYVYAGFYALLTTALLAMSGDASQVLVSLMNVILVLVPLVATLFGITYYYHTREFIELLLAQPVRRRSIFSGLYLGVAGSLSASLVIGAGIPLAAGGIFTGTGEPGGGFALFATPESVTAVLLLGVGVFLTAIFTALAFLVALRFENRVKGFGLSILIWLAFAVLYDGLFLYLLSAFSDYPLERFALGFSMLNPIDLGRILLLLRLDISALMGYTGAVFQSFFGSGLGMAVTLGALLIWATLPVGAMLRLAGKKDF